MTLCVYCHRPGATLRINRSDVAHPRCFRIADIWDETMTLGILPPYAPDELTAYHVPERRRSMSPAAIRMRRMRAARASL
jgi:hypothetical protein